MGTLLTVIIGAAVIGYAAKIVWGIVQKTKAGECSGCSHCPASENCDSKK